MSGDWRPQRIAGHAFLSDGQTAALVYEDATIDWLCMPRFDSEACFASLLGTGEHGGWWLHPTEEVRSRTRAYIDETLVLRTIVETASGAVAITDFMPSERGQAPDIVRIVEGLDGEVEMLSRLALRFDNGRTHPAVQVRDDNNLIAMAGPNAVALRCDCPVEATDGHFESRFRIRAGERRSLILTWFPGHEQAPDAVDSGEALADTLHFWKRWSDKTDYDGVATAEVKRSLLVLKGLIHSATGGMLAAATASLPEHPGGRRNWDYRYCWLRDAAFTLLALIHTGHPEEAGAWIDWLRRAIAGEPIDVQPFYGIDGKRHTIEWEADWLPGFGDARPVRMGNAAVSQCQLDIYGEVIDALAIASRHGLAPDAAHLASLLAGKLEAIWQQPDAGIWESRGTPSHHVYSKAMCWVAFDRTATLVERQDPDAALHWRNLANKVRDDVLAKGVSGGRFKAAYDSDALDAALLRLPVVGFVDAEHPVMAKTIASIEDELVRDGLVWRYRDKETDDGVGGGEGAFLAAGCWLADAFAMQGRDEDARHLFERLLACANDLGILSEEALPQDRSAWGNVPQALSHVAIVNTALTLSARGRPPRRG